MPPVLSIITEPKCLIESGPDGKMAVNSEVLEELKSIEGQVVVVSIAGPYRTGKSFLMNKLYGQNKELKGNTMQPEPVGSHNAAEIDRNEAVDYNETTITINVVLETKSVTYSIGRDDFFIEGSTSS